MKFLALFMMLATFGTLVRAAYIKPVEPLDDEFYEIPSNIDDHELGDIVKWRPAPQMIRSVLFPINIQNAWQYMVRSTNSQGEAIGIVGTVLEPYNADPTKMVVYSFAEDSASPNCAPSYSILYGASASTIALQLESLFMNTLLTKGWYVVIPDYEGPNAAFVAGRLGGMATLDSIRGILSSGNETSIEPDAQVALWGFSGGTLPTSWATVLQPSYAPELSENLVGAAFGGWVSNITRTLHYLEGGIFSGFVASGILGLVTEYPAVQDEIWDFVDPKKRSALKEAKSQCLVQTLLSFPYTKYFTGKHPYFPDGYSVLERPEVNAMLLDNTITANKSIGVPQIPLFLYHGKPDEVIPFENAEEGFDAFCEWGVESFEFTASNTSGHIVEYIEGAGAVLKWIGERFEGKAPVKGCQRTDRVSTLDYPGVDLGYYDILATDKNAIAFDPLGPNPQTNKTISRVGESIFDLVKALIEKVGPIPVKRDLMVDSSNLDQFLRASS